MSSIADMLDQAWSSQLANNADMRSYTSQALHQLRAAYDEGSLFTNFSDQSISMYLEGFVNNISVSTDDPSTTTLVHNARKALRDALRDIFKACMKSIPLNDLNNVSIGHLARHLSHKTSELSIGNAIITSKVSGRALSIALKHASTNPLGLGPFLAEMKELQLGPRLILKDRLDQWRISLYGNQTSARGSADFKISPGETAAQSGTQEVNLKTVQRLDIDHLQGSHYFINILHNFIYCLILTYIYIKVLLHTIIHYRISDMIRRLSSLNIGPIKRPPNL